MLTRIVHRHNVESYGKAHEVINPVLERREKVDKLRSLYKALQLDTRTRIMAAAKGRPLQVDSPLPHRSTSYVWCPAQLGRHERPSRPAPSNPGRGESDTGIKRAQPVQSATVGVIHGPTGEAVALMAALHYETRVMNK